jgi:hypothetical protein
MCHGAPVLPIGAVLVRIARTWEPVRRANARSDIKSYAAPPAPHSGETVVPDPSLSMHMVRKLATWLQRPWLVLFRSAT